MGFSRKHASALLATAVCATAANAEQMTFDFSGFGTGGVAWSDTNKGEFIRDAQPRGVDNSADVGLDSVLGVQGTVHFSPDISGTAQMMFRRSTNTSFSLDVTLAFLKDQITNDFAVRVGRLQLPTFMISEYRQIGYANTFIRPPLEVYGQSPLDYVDGVDGQYTHSFGPIELVLGAFYGKADLNSGGFSVSAKKFGGGNISAAWGPLTLHYNRNLTHLTLANSGLDQLFAGLSAAGFANYASQLETTNKPSAFSDFGVSLDWHNVLVQAEASQSNVGGFIADTRGRYALGGYRIHKFTPYVMYAVRKPISQTSQTVIPAVGPLLPLAGAVDALIAAFPQHTTSCGVRWDFRESMDIKLQYDHVSPTGPGLFVNVQPGFSGPVNVAAVAVDFVF